MLIWHVLCAHPSVAPTGDPMLHLKSISATPNSILLRKAPKSQKLRWITLDFSILPLVTLVSRGDQTRRLLSLQSLLFPSEHFLYVLKENINHRDFVWDSAFLFYAIKSYGVIYLLIKMMTCVIVVVEWLDQSILQAYVAKYHWHMMIRGFSFSEKLYI